MDKKYKNLTIELSKISNYFGQRYDLIQAAGGCLLYTSDAADE